MSENNRSVNNSMTERSEGVAQLSIVDGDEMSSLQLFIEDQRQIDPGKKIPYLLMVARGNIELIPDAVDISEEEPFKKAIGLGILKKKPISLSKQLLCQEIKRRNPSKKVNVNNKKIEELFAMIRDEKDESNIVSASDKLFIEEEVAKYLDHVRKGIEEVEEKKREAGGRIDMSDRLRYILALDHCGYIREAYMNSQNVLSRQELDARNTTAAQRDFHDLIVEKFNDPNWTPNTTAMPDLHSYYSMEHLCPKKDSYTLTREKSKQLLQDMKHKLNEICKRYEKSGNGAGQLDEDGDEVRDGSGQNFGRFNLELANLKGGDDRQNFLNHEPLDLLYWWDVMDQHNLIHFTTAQLRGCNAANSDEVPASTSYSDSSVSTIGNGGGSARKKQKIDLSSIHAGIKENVATVGLALCKMNDQCLMEQIDNLTHKKRDLKNEWRKEKKLPGYDSDDGEFFKDAIDEIEQLIAAKQGLLNSSGNI